MKDINGVRYTQFKPYIKANKKKRLALAYNLGLNFHEYLYQNIPVMEERMKIFEFFIFAPLLCDGPINEEERAFINAAMCRRDKPFSMEKVTQLAERNMSPNAAQEIADIYSKYDVTVRIDILDLIFLGLIFDEKKRLNEAEEKFFVTIQDSFNKQ